MDSTQKQLYSNSHRYVIDEDSIPKVTSDGEPHEVMTMVAAFSGVIVAGIVLVILIMLIGRRNPNRRNQQQSQIPAESNVVKSAVIVPIFNKTKTDGAPELMSISTIGYNNPTFETRLEIQGNQENRDENTETILSPMNLPQISTIKC